MSERPSKILILDYDPDVLTHLQHVFEDAGIDTTITWDDFEARELVRTRSFDLVLIGNRHPELSVKTFLHGLQPTARACLLLGARESSAKRAKPLRRLGISGVVPKRDAKRVLQLVQEHLGSESTRAESRTAA